tara:strand:- start:2106 stop:2720 length:615 start_codon:yes stop_codon:yes gene_type:complete
MAGKKNENEELDLSKTQEVYIVDKDEASLRLVSLYGSIEEEPIGELCVDLLTLKEIIKYSFQEGDDKTIDFIISTYGGEASETFALYDIMRVVRKDCDIATFGLGKVMSGGVLLLASGTKGKRKIGKNCRLMIHSVVGTSHGSLYSLENEMEEVRWIQERYTKALAEESKMTEKYIKEELFEKKMNVYLSAEEAVELGIADEIV